MAQSKMMYTAKTFYILRIYDPHADIHSIMEQLKGKFPNACVEYLQGFGTHLHVNIPLDTTAKFVPVHWRWYKAQLPFNNFSPGSTVSVTINQHAVLVGFSEAPEEKYIPTQLSDGCDEFRISTLERLEQKDVEGIVPGFQWFDKAGTTAEKELLGDLEKKLKVQTALLRNQKEALCTQTKMLRIQEEKHAMMREDFRSNCVRVEEDSANMNDRFKALRRQKKKLAATCKRMEAKVDDTLQERLQVAEDAVAEAQVALGKAEEKTSQLQCELVEVQAKVLKMEVACTDGLKREKSWEQKLKSMQDRFSKKNKSRLSRMESLEKEIGALQKDLKRAQKDRNIAETEMVVQISDKKTREERLLRLEKENEGISDVCEALRHLVGISEQYKGNNREIIDRSVVLINNVLQEIYRMSPDNVSMEELKQKASMYYHLRPKSSALTIALLKSCYTTTLLHYREKKEEVERVTQRAEKLSETVRVLRLRMKDYILHPHSNMSPGSLCRASLKKFDFPCEKTVCLSAKIQGYAADCSKDNFLTTIQNLYQLDTLYLTGLISDKAAYIQGVVRLQRWFRMTMQRVRLRKDASSFLRCKAAIRIQRWVRWNRMKRLADILDSGKGTLAGTNVRKESLQRSITACQRKHEDGDARNILRKQTLTFARKKNSHGEFFGRVPNHVLYEQIMEQVVNELTMSTPITMSPVRLRTLIREQERFNDTKMFAEFDALKQFCKNRETGGLNDLKQYLQKGFDDAVRNFITKVYRNHPNDWKEHLLCGIYIPRGNVDELKKLLFERYHQHTSVFITVAEVAQNFGLDGGDAEDLVRRWTTLQGFAIQELKGKNIQIRLKGSGEKPDSPVNVMVI